MITMDEIAKRAGVARSTASGILNGRDGQLRISAETRRRVLDVAQEMGYQRNELARAVAAGKNFVLGYLTQDTREQEALILKGVLEGAGEEGYLVKVLVKDADEHFREVARRCAEHRLAGLVMRRFFQDEVTQLNQEMARYKIPLIFVDDTYLVPDMPSVTSDDRQGIFLALDHLVSLGHRAIAYFAGICDHPQAILRRQAFLDGMSDRNLAVRPEWVLEAKWDHERAELLAGQLFGNPNNRPTAIVVDGDEAAAGALRGLWELGLRVPADVSVIGYGGLSLGMFLYPPLTTISQPFARMGRVAVTRLLSHISRMDGQDTTILAGTDLLATELLLRRSTAPPKV